MLMLFELGRKTDLLAPLPLGSGTDEEYGIDSKDVVVGGVPAAEDDVRAWLDV